MDALPELAALVRRKNAIDDAIAALVQRPAQVGHVGEYIASRVFDITLERSATHKDSDGRFQSGPLQGCTVNIKWYLKREGLLDLSAYVAPDHYYLVMTGPKAAPVASIGATRPWVIDYVFLFNAAALCHALTSKPKPVKIGVATSVTKDLWAAAEIYPHASCPWLTVSGDQRARLALFSSSASE